MQPARYLERIRIEPNRVESFDSYPFSLGFVASLDLRFRRAVTFLVGENGCGKSTILESIAGLLNLPASGGGTAESGFEIGPRSSSGLAEALRPSFRVRPRDAYFFRSEFAAHFGELLDERQSEPTFKEDPYESYGGRSIFRRSHGEGFLAILKNRLRDGLYLLDEPESALSPQRQLAAMTLIASRAKNEGAQFIIATHSPLLMTIPGAEILAITDEAIESASLFDTDHYRVTKSILENPAAFWRHVEFDESEC